MKNILIISYSPLHSDPRIQRQIEAFKWLYNIETVGWTNPDVDGVERHFNVERPYACKNFYEKVCKALRILFTHPKNEIYLSLYIDYLVKLDYAVPDMIVANDWNGLYAAARLKEDKRWQSKIYFNAHEYFPKYINTLFWKVFEKPLIMYTFKTYRKEIAVMSTVCESLARMYEKYFGFEDGFVKVVTNAPKYETCLVPKEIYWEGYNKYGYFVACIYIPIYSEIDYAIYARADEVLSCAA